MIIIISSAKSLAESPQYNFNPTPSYPRGGEHTQTILTTLRQLNQIQLGHALGVSEKLAALNHERLQQLPNHKTSEHSLPAIFAYNGDVFKSLSRDAYSPTDWQNCNSKLRIISALFGLTRPFDLISPYRLEMSTSLNSPQLKDLKKYWQPIISKQLNEDIAASEGDQILLNLASKEYSAAVDTSTLEYPVINIEFRQFKNGVYKNIALLSKKARGMMADFIITHNINSVAKLKNFNTNGYVFDAAASNKHQLIFKQE